VTALRSRILIPLLAVLALSWGTCPCFYAEILTGGLVHCGTGNGAGCACARTCSEDGCPSERRAREGGAAGVTPNPTPPPGHCPCVDSVGVMHELPRVEAEALTPPAPALAGLLDHRLLAGTWVAVPLPRAATRTVPDDPLGRSVVRLL